jgi:hypothetical protein
MPLLQAAAAASSRGVLRHEGGMVAERGLLAIVQGNGGGEALVDELGSMLHDLRESFALEVRQLPPLEPEAAAESGSLKLLKDLVQSTHRHPIR